MTTTQPKTLRTGHVGLNVSDLDRSKTFYLDVFGFDVAGESSTDDRRFLFLSHGDELLLTLWQQSDGTFPTASPGLHHLSFQVESIEDVRAAEERLRRLGTGFAYDGVVPHGEGASSGGIFFHDPDGIRLEIYAAAGADAAAAPTTGAPTCGFF